MIRSILKRVDLGNQRGGIAILTALGFLLFSIPLITSSLNLAQNTAIDSRVKTGIAHRQYCGLAVQEYLTYLLSDGSRWAAWLTANVDPSDPSGQTYTETVTPCAEDITITVSQLPVIPPTGGGDPDDSITIPQLSDFDGREFEVTKMVSNSNPAGGASVMYTISILNRDDTALDLEKIEDTMPFGFTYDCNSDENQLTLPNGSPQDFPPKDRDDLCNEDDDIINIEWVLPDDTSIPPGQTATLTFYAVTNTDDGNYCNTANVVPGGDKTSNGMTAPVQIGAVMGPCSGDSVVVTKNLDTATLVSTNTSTFPFTYTFNIDFTITIDNRGTEDLKIKELKDWLPEGFSYVSTSPFGDITDIPEGVFLVSEVNRERVTWKPDPEVELDPGESKTLKFSTTASITRGNYYSDITVELGDGTFSEDRYTWPTALVSVNDVYTVSATTEGGTQVVIALQVLIGDQDGVVSTWTLQ